MRLAAPHRPLAFGLALIALTTGGCVSDRCGPLSIYLADEARMCVNDPIVAPELEVCMPASTPTDVEIICLVSDAGQLAWAVIGNEARVSGTGWRHTTGTGTQALSPAEQQRCTAFEASAGGPVTSRRCPTAP